MAANVLTKDNCPMWLWVLMIPVGMMSFFLLARNAPAPRQEEGRMAPHAEQATPMAVPPGGGSSGPSRTPHARGEK